MVVSLEWHFMEQRNLLVSGAGATALVCLGLAVAVCGLCAY